MGKKKNVIQEPAQLEEKSVIPRAAAYPGGMLLLIGFAAFYLSGRANPGVFTWHTYGAIALMVLGGLLWFTSGMDKAHLLEWFRSAFIALSIALVIRWAVVEPYRIPSGSMEPTLHGDPGFGKGDRVFVNKWVYGLRFPFMNKRLWQGSMPQRWDLVVFKSVEEDAVHKTLVKRIVGMPGEHFQIKEGNLLVDGNPLELPQSMPEDMYYTSPLNAPYGVQEPDSFSRIPEGHYLVMGDNSAHSRDGRYFGWLPNENIVGRVSCIWWPPPRWRDFTGFTTTIWWKALVVFSLLCVVLRLFFLRLCAVQLSPDKKDVEHLVVSFIRYGLHVPLLRSSLIRWRKPARGDLVLYSTQTAEKKDTLLLVGRIAGLPGEQISFTDGALTINNIPAPLPPPAPDTYTPAPPNAPYGRSKTKDYSVVPEESYFILSDAAGGVELALDSRTCGWVPAPNIQGRALLCWWPSRRCGKR